MTNPLDDLAKIIETPMTGSQMAELVAIHDKLANAPVDVSLADLSLDNIPWGKIGSGGTSYADAFLGIAPFEPIPTTGGTSLDLGEAIETPREHNERKYPDLMSRLYGLADRTGDDDE